MATFTQDVTVWISVHNVSYEIAGAGGRFERPDLPEEIKAGIGELASA